MIPRTRIINKIIRPRLKQSLIFNQRNFSMQKNNESNKESNKELDEEFSKRLEKELDKKFNRKLNRGSNREITEFTGVWCIVLGGSIIVCYGIFKIVIFFSPMTGGIFLLGTGTILYLKNEILWLIEEAKKNIDQKIKNKL